MFTVIVVVLLLLLAVFIALKGSFISKIIEVPSAHVYIASFLGIISLMTLALNSWTIVQPGHAKVQVMLGDTQPKALAAGFHIINPVLDLEDFNVQDHTETIERIGVPAQDKLKSMMDISITLAADPALVPQMYETAGALEVAYGKYVTPKVRSLLRESGKSVQNSQDFFKEEVQQQLQSSLEGSLREYLAPKGFIIKAVLIRDINLPKVVRDAIVMTKQREEQINQEKAKLLIVEQSALAQVKEAEAREKAAVADAGAIRTLAEAEAFKVVTEATAKAKGNALVNKSLTNQLIEYNRVQQWDGVLPRMTGIGATPMMNINSIK